MTILRTTEAIVRAVDVPALGIMGGLLRSSVDVLTWRAAEVPFLVVADHIERRAS